MEVRRIETLGERIRKIRKQQKLTLEGLAGKSLTKGMLSLIENNKANPSMESLNYIAERLGLEVSELLEDVSTQELRDVLEEAEQLYHVEYDKLTDEYEQLITLVEPYIPKLTQGYEAARLLEIYSRCMHREKKSDWKVLFDRAVEMYEHMNLTARRIEMGIFYSLTKFVQHNYNESLEILLNERKKIVLENTFIDPMSRIDLDYHESILHFAVGDYTAAVQVMNNAINFSKKNRVFYNIDHLYRLAAIHAMMEKNEEETNYYLKKLIQYGEFADDQEALYFAKFIKAHYLNSYKKNYKEAFLLLDQYVDELGVINPLSSFLNLERGKSLYGLSRFEEALEAFNYLDKITIADYLHHPLDLSMFYEADAYVARCHLALGSKEQAMHFAQLAVDNISPMPHTPYKDFIMETYELVTK